MNNREEPIQSEVREPTLTDLYELLKMTASKKDMDEIKAEIRANNTETNEKIEKINERIDTTEAISTIQSAKIEMLETSIERIKQEHLKNNICISGIPSELIEDNNTAEIVIAIANVLGIEINEENFVSYSIAQKKFIIVKMHKGEHKQALLSTIRTKKSLMIEEVFETNSNNQIYLNDHLTPYSNRLYQLARTAKKEGKIATVSSAGGQIKVRKQIKDIPIIITSDNKLQQVINGHSGEPSNTATKQARGTKNRNNNSAQPKNKRKITPTKGNNNKRIITRSNTAAAIIST